MPVPPRFLQRIRELCDQHGIVMIADEVQCGFARTGKLFALEHYGLGGRHHRHRASRSAPACRSAPSPAAPTSWTRRMSAGWAAPTAATRSTCVAAIAAIEMMRQPAFLARAERSATMLRETLDGWKSASSADRRRPRPGLDDADRAGEGPRDEGARARRDAGDPQERRAGKGVIAMRAGLFTNGIRFLPPLVITDDQLREGLGVIEARARRSRGAASRPLRRSQTAAADGWPAAPDTDPSITASCWTGARRPADATALAVAGGPHRGRGRATTRFWRLRGPDTHVVDLGRTDAASRASSTRTRTSGRSVTC